MNINGELFMECNLAGQSFSDSRYKENHFIQKEWKMRDGFKIGEKNVINEPLVTKEKIILPR